jgi:hypothetical protein
MAFAFAVLERSIIGNKHMMIGYYQSAGGSTGGDIGTELRGGCDVILLQVHAAAVVAAPAVVNETVDLDVLPEEPTIVTTANEGGRFIAIGNQ